MAQPKIRHSQKLGTAIIGPAKIWKKFAQKNFGSANFGCWPSFGLFPNTIYDQIKLQNIVDTAEAIFFEKSDPTKIKVDEIESSESEGEVDDYLLIGQRL